MVGPIMLMKILHCKNLKRRKSSKTKDSSQGPSHGTSSQNTHIKKESRDDDEEYTCRVCLKEGRIPIYGHSGFEDMSIPLMTFGSIDVSPLDAYPKYLCHSCNALLQGAVLFRKTAQQSEKILQQPSQDDVVDDDSILNNCDDYKFDYEVEGQMFTEEEERTKAYRCKRCKLDFDTYEEYSDHRLSDEHENVRVNCKICNKSYALAYLKKHLAIHQPETTFMCDICGKKFIIQGQFTRHRLTHFYDLPFQCSLCPYKGRFSESLKMHMRSHTGEKPYQCPQCPSRYFVNKSNLNKHMLTHKSGHDYKCDQCQRGFYSKRELELHFKVDHSGIKDHICNICGKAFGYRKQMMKHQLKVHKREKLRSGRTPLYILAESKNQDE